MVTTLLIGLGAYLLGSIPFAQLVAATGGLDLRRVGSGAASTSNVWHNLGLLPAVIAAMGDIGKGVIPAAIAAATGGPQMAAYVAVCAMIGHTWSVFLRFNGGRGIGITLATAAVLLPKELALALIPMVLLILLLRDSAPGTVLAVVLVPLLATLFGEPPGMVLPYFAMAALVLLRRLTAPAGALESGRLTLENLASRLIFDRPDRRHHWSLDSVSPNGERKADEGPFSNGTRRIQ